MTEPIPDEWADKLNETMRGRAAVYGKPVEPGPLREDAKAALAALAVIAPLIERQIREQIAAEIEAEAVPPGGVLALGAWNFATFNAARIARGTTTTEENTND